MFTCRFRVFERILLHLIPGGIFEVESGSIRQLKEIDIHICGFLLYGFPVRFKCLISCDPLEMFEEFCGLDGDGDGQAPSILVPGHPSAGFIEGEDFLGECHHSGYFPLNLFDLSITDIGYTMNEGFRRFLEGGCAVFKPIDPNFFKQPVLDLAPALLGQYIVHETDAGLTAARIVETEAYLGPEDRAAHSFNNRRTKRTEVMFAESGRIYTYQMHTHTLMNVVAGEEGIPHAILIRGAEPVEGLELMQGRRGRHLKIPDLTNGPGKLSKALGVTMQSYGGLWYKEPLYIAPGPGLAGELKTGKRVGIQNSGEAVHYPWRFFEADNPFVSKYR